MKRLLIVPALLLASCAPVMSALPIFTGLENGSIVIPAGSTDLTGDPSRPGDGVGLVIQGTPDYSPDKVGLEVCKASLKVPGQFACNLGTIPAGRSFVVKTKAGKVVDFNGSGYRGSSAAPVPIIFRP